MEDLFISISVLSFILLLSTLLILINLNNNNKKNHNPNPNPNPPIPPRLPLIGHLHLLKHPIHRALAHLSVLHGPILLLRFGSSPVLLVSSSSVADECFTVNELTFANRPRFLSGKYLGYNYRTLILASYSPLWRNFRGSPPSKFSPLTMSSHPRTSVSTRSSPSSRPSSVTTQDAASASPSSRPSSLALLAMSS
ncbi:putative cytochrome P450 [Dioscorea sansibarensis]